jgi:tetratricopeptide (TPR) repeat protein
MENGASAQLSDMFFWMLGRSHLSSRRYEEIRQVLEQRYVDRLSKCTNEQLVRALDLYGDTLRVLGGQEALDLQTKQWYANAVVDALSYRQFQTLPECSPILTKAQRMNDDCRRSIACLSMAVQLDETASKLESQGSYSMAEKLYRQCLEIKEKNLGKTAPETLAVYGDLARLCADQKQYPQAESLYDQALNGFRKLPVPGVEYGRVLESYADMLAQLKQTSKADKLYAEARAHYATAGSVH